MTKDEILALIAKLDNDNGGEPAWKWDRESAHFNHDDAAAAVLTYIAEGGEDPAAVAQAMLQHESPTEWGWYA